MAFKDFDVPDYLKNAESFSVTSMSLTDRAFVIKYKAKLKDVISGEIKGETAKQFKILITGNWNADSQQLKNKADKKGFFQRNIDLLIKGFSSIYSGQGADYIAQIKETLKRQSEEAAKVQLVNSDNNTEPGKNNNNNKEPKIIKHHVQKYHNVWEGNELYESVLIGNEPYFVSIDRDVGEEETHIRSRLVSGFSQTSVKDNTITKILPKELLTYISKPYVFESQIELDHYLNKAATKETLDSIYDKVKKLAKKYVDASDTHHTILAADCVFTYFQDIFGQTHYLYFYGDNSSGKTINLQFLSLLGFRPMYDVDVTEANIYTYLGSVEEGQGIILEDEADGLDYKQNEKMKIYKKGYNSGGKVTRTETGGDTGRRSDGFYVYCFKAFTGEKKLDPDYAKGFNERTFYLECQEGDPQYDLSEVVSPAGAENLEALRQEIEDTRKLLLAFRLVRRTDSFPNIDIAVRNREKQLTKPVIRLFQNSECLKDVSKALGEMIAIRRGVKRDTLEYAIYQVLTELINERDTYRFGAKLIYTSLKSKLDGEYKNEGKDQAFDTPDHGMVSHKKINSICEDRFGAKKERTRDGNMLIFDKDRFEKVKAVYSLNEQGIEIIKQNGSNNNGEGVKVLQVQQGSEPSFAEKPQEANDENRSEMQEDVENSQETDEEDKEFEESGEWENV
jgi:hypothetical protein